MPRQPNITLKMAIDLCHFHNRRVTFPEEAN